MLQCVAVWFLWGKTSKILPHYAHFFVIFPPLNEGFLFPTKAPCSFFEIPLFRHLILQYLAFTAYCWTSKFVPQISQIFAILFLKSSSEHLCEQYFLSLHLFILPQFKHFGYVFSLCALPFFSFIYYITNMTTKFSFISFIWINIKFFITYFTIYVNFCHVL